MLVFDFSLKRGRISISDYTSSANEIRYDISLLKLQGKVTFTDYIRPICLPAQGVDVELDDECWVTGWGRTESKRFMYEWQ